jgi:hypothetical protein
MIERPKQRPPAVPRFSLEDLGFVTVLIGILYYLSPWPIAQMYSICAAGTAFTVLTTWRAAKQVPRTDKLRSSQFSLQTLLVWILPLAALVAWIVSWGGYFQEDYLNAIVKGVSLMILTPLWFTVFLWRRRFNRSAKRKTL